MITCHPSPGFSHRKSVCLSGPEDRLEWICGGLGRLPAAISSLYSHPYAPHRACSPVPCLILCSGLTILYAAPSICLAVFHLWVFAHAASPSKNILLCSLFQLLLSLLAQSQWLFLQAVLQDFSLLHLYSVLTPDQMGSAIFPMLPPSLPVSFTSGF